jgi:hypothetical protein
MPFCLANTDNFAAKQSAGTDVTMQISGDDRTISGSVDAYGILAQSTLTATAVSYLAPASGHDFIVTHIMVANPGSNSRTITFYLDKGATTYDATTQWGPAITLLSGESAEWNDNGGWNIYNTTGVSKIVGGPTYGRQFYAPAQAITATRVYMTNTSILSVLPVVAGQRFRWNVYLTKTNAGTVAPIFELLIGTNGSLSDTARFVTNGTVWAMPMLAGTAAADKAILEVEAWIVGAGASGTVFGKLELRHQLAATGFGVGQCQEQHGTTGAIDISAASLQMGLAVTAGTSAVWTLDAVILESYTP